MTLGIANINLCITSKLPIIKNKLPCDNGISCGQIFTVNSKSTSMYLFTMCSFYNYLLLLVIIIQHIVKIGLVAEISIPNYQSLFFKLTQLP